MSDANKILTVSYGTFSCTLEGFDKPFEAMKAIAEYFRDLAAEDRYFGAEPPTPDTEMLHRITEAAIQRRVEARIMESGLLLRAQPEPLDTADTAAPPAKAQAPAQPEIADADLADDTITPEPDAEGQAVDPAELQDATPEVAAEAVAEADVEMAAEAEAEAEAEVMSAVEAMPEVEVAPETTPDVALEDDSTGDAGAAPQDTATMEDLVDEPAPAMTAEAMATSPDLPAADDIAIADDASDDAALLAQMADLAEAAPADAVITDEAPVRVTAPAQVTDLATDGADTLAAVAAALADAPQAELTQPTLEAPSAPAPTAEDDAAFFADVGQDDITLDAASLFGDAAAMDGASVAERIARIRRASTEEEYDAQAEMDFDAEFAQQPEAEAQALAADDDADTMALAAIAQDLAPAPVAAQQPTPQMAEVLDDYDDGFDDDNAPTDDDDAITAAITAATARDTAPAPQPSAPAAQIAQPAEPVTPPQAEAETAPAQPPETPQAMGDLEAADRLFAATESRMSNADTTRRRANIAHLKAAVAARSAERELAPAADEDADDAAEYREDLAQVMRPRRVRVDVTRRADAARPTPLILVSEQRIDDAAQHAGGEPIRPRRVMAPGMQQAAATAAAPLRLTEAAPQAVAAPRNIANSLAQLAQRAGVIMNLRRTDAAAEQAPAATTAAAAPEPDTAQAQPAPAPVHATLDASHAEHFAQILDQSDAVEIDEVIELAAGYAQSVFGTGTFDRTQLFRMIADATDQSISPEEMLHSFGDMMRHGRIERVARGAFRLSQTAIDQ